MLIRGMTTPIRLLSDPCPNLSLAIDIAGDKYYLGTDKPVELGYKSRKDFFIAFGDNSNTQCLLRKYMPIGNNVLKTVFDSASDRTQLITILEERAESLKASNQFNSSVLKNSVIQRNYLEILKVINGLKGEPYQPKEWGKGLKERLEGLKGIKPSMFTPTSSYKEYAMSLTDDQKIQLVLEMAWFLMHPDQVPSKAQRRWFKMIKRLDTLRLDDFAGLSQKIQEMIEKNPKKPLINYFKTMNLSSIIELKDKDNLQYLKSDALEKVFDSACDRDKAILEERMRIILQLLRAKEYLSDIDVNSLKDVDNMVDPSIFSDLSGSMVENPGGRRSNLMGGAQVGGAEQREMTHGLRKSLVPFFDYFSGLYDPVYGVLDRAISDLDDSSSKPSVDELIRLFNIVSKINPENDPNKYGVYRIVGVENSVIEFVRNLIKSTEFYSDKLPDSEKKEYFEDLEKLPQVRISSVINQFSSKYKDPSKLPFVSLMLIDAGITIPTEDDIEDPNKGFIRKSMDSHGVSSANKTLSSLNFGQIHQAIKDFFLTSEDSIFIVCNNEKDKLPLVLYDIDINTIKLEDVIINGTLLENNYFNMLKINEDALYMDDLLEIDNENIVNEAVFALAIFISLKNLFNE
jgi:hypothetical protein